MGAASERKYYLFALRAFSGILGIIALPAVIAVLVKYLLQLDKRTFFVTLVVAFVLSAVVLVRKIKQYGQEFQKLVDERGDGPSGR